MMTLSTPLLVQKYEKFSFDINTKSITIYLVEEIFN